MQDAVKLEPPRRARLTGPAVPPEDVIELLDSSDDEGAAPARAAAGANAAAGAGIPLPSPTTGNHHAHGHHAPGRVPVVRGVGTRGANHAGAGCSSQEQVAAPRGSAGPAPAAAEGGQVAGPAATCQQEPTGKPKAGSTREANKSTAAGAYAAAAVAPQPPPAARAEPQAAAVPTDPAAPAPGARPAAGPAAAPHGHPAAASGAPASVVIEDPRHPPEQRAVDCKRFFVAVQVGRVVLGFDDSSGEMRDQVVRFWGKWSGGAPLLLTAVSSTGAVLLQDWPCKLRHCAGVDSLSSRIIGRTPSGTQALKHSGIVGCIISHWELLQRGDYTAAPGSTGVVPARLAVHLAAPSTAQQPRPAAGAVVEDGMTQLQLATCPVPDDVVSGLLGERAVHWVGWPGGVPIALQVSPPSSTAQPTCHRVLLRWVKQSARDSSARINCAALVNQCRGHTVQRWELTAPGSYPPQQPAARDSSGFPSSQRACITLHLVAAGPAAEATQGAASRPAAGGAGDAHSNPPAPADDDQAAVGRTRGRSTGGSNADEAGEGAAPRAPMRHATCRPSAGADSRPDGQNEQAAGSVQQAASRGAATNVTGLVGRTLWGLKSCICAKAAAALLGPDFALPQAAGAQVELLLTLQPNPSVPQDVQAVLQAHSKQPATLKCYSNPKGGIAYSLAFLPGSLSQRQLQVLRLTAHHEVHPAAGAEPAHLVLGVEPVPPGGRGQRQRWRCAEDEAEDVWSSGEETEDDDDDEGHEEESEEEEGEDQGEKEGMEEDGGGGGGEGVGREGAVGGGGGGEEEEEVGGQAGQGQESVEHVGNGHVGGDGAAVQPPGAAHSPMWGAAPTLHAAWSPAAPDHSHQLHNVPAPSPASEAHATTSIRVGSVEANAAVTVPADEPALLQHPPRTKRSLASLITAKVKACKVRGGGGMSEAKHTAAGSGHAAGSSASTGGDMPGMPVQSADGAQGGPCGKVTQDDVARAMAAAAAAAAAGCNRANTAAAETAAGPEISACENGSRGGAAQQRGRELDAAPVPDAKRQRPGTAAGAATGSKETGEGRQQGAAGSNRQQGGGGPGVGVGADKGAEGRREMCGVGGDVPVSGDGSGAPKGVGAAGVGDMLGSSLAGPDGHVRAPAQPQSPPPPPAAVAGAVPPLVHPPMQPPQSSSQPAEAQAQAAVPPAAPQPAPPPPPNAAASIGTDVYDAASLATAMNPLLNGPTQALRELRDACLKCLKDWGVGLSEAVTAVGGLYQLKGDQLVEVYVHGLEHAQLLLVSSGSKQEAAKWLMSKLRHHAQDVKP